MKLWMVGSNIIDLISNLRCTEDRKILRKVATQVDHIATQNEICVATYAKKLLRIPRTLFPFLAIL